MVFFLSLVILICLLFRLSREARCLTRRSREGMRCAGRAYWRFFECNATSAVLLINCTWQAFILVFTIDIYSVYRYFTLTADIM